MPSIKQIISDFFRTHCKRQLYYNLRRDEIPEDVAKALEDNRKNNRILQQLLKSGQEWETEKFSELSDCFNSKLLGRPGVVDDRKKDEKGRDIYQKLDAYLKDKFPRHLSGTFLFEPEFELSGDWIWGIGYGDTESTPSPIFRPDILELLPDQLPESHESKFRRYLTADGRVLPMDESDDRQRLRVIDIKLLSQTSPSYFAEVTLYSMILASWLREHGLDSEYAVVANAAIWPGSYEESCLKKAYQESHGAESVSNRTMAHRAGSVSERITNLWLAMQDDLEEAPIEAFIGAVRQFFKETVPEVLAMTSAEADAQACITHQCRACEYLDCLDRRRPACISERENTMQTVPLSPTGRRDACGPRFLGCRQLAQNTGHLSLVPMISEGTITLLRDEFGVQQTENLSELSHEKILQSDCKFLKASGRIAIERAKAIRQITQSHGAGSVSDRCPPARLLDETGTSCEMPKSPDVHVYLHTDYDFVRWITLSLGVRVVGKDGQNETKIHIVEENNIEKEADIFVRFCENIVEILDKNAAKSIQFYYWDDKQYEHFQRLVERHRTRIKADEKLARIVFLTPPDTVLPNPEMETWQSPRTIVSEVLSPRLVAAIPYHYSLLETARHFHDSSKTADSFKMPELRDEIFGGSLPFEEPLSSQIPSDRIYDLWNLSQQEDDESVEERVRLLEAVEKAVEIQLDALESITLRTESDMGETLFSMPPKANQIKTPQPDRIAVDSEIWLRFSKLNANANELENKQVHVLSTVEKETQCESIKIVHFLRDAERDQALVDMELPVTEKVPFVCRISEDSCNAKFEKGQFSCSIAPINDLNFLASSPKKYDMTSFGIPYWTQTMAELTAVDVVAIDRERRLIAITPKVHKYEKYKQNIDVIRQLIVSKVLNLNSFLLEKTVVDIFTNRLTRVVRCIGNPPEAAQNQISRRLGYESVAAESERPLSESTPASSVLWNAKELSETPVERNLASIFQFLDEKNISLNASQRLAVERTLSKRLSLLWGPPGTGKSKTLCAIALGAIHDALTNKKPLRILITGPTNTAIDNVLHELHRQLAEVFPNEMERIHCARFASNPSKNAKIPEYKSDWLPEEIAELLWKKSGIIIIGSTPHQVYKLPNSQNSSRNALFHCGELFDLILLDEASQVEMSQAILILTTLDGNGSLVIAGDPLQMPPIQQASIPKGLGPMLGSVYEFFAHEKTYGIKPNELLVNYRSNAAIVNLAREANYPPGLESHSPNLAIQLKSDSKTMEPWVSSILDPNLAVCAFFRKDGKSNQLDSFEAYCVERIVAALRENLLQELGESQTTNHNSQSTIFHTNETFWTKGIGIVTPHRAQQAMVVSRLQNLFCKGKGEGTAKLKTWICEAVDTVERFQGQQRDVIIVSFGMGDRDAIKKEEEFLMNLNRFNVMTSRPRAKLIVFLSEELANYVPEDAEVQKQSRLLKAFTDVFCNNAEPLSVAWEGTTVDGTFKYYISDQSRTRFDQSRARKEADGAANRSPLPDGRGSESPQLGKQWFKRGEYSSFDDMFGECLSGATRIEISDRFISKFSHFYYLMELVKTIHRKMKPGEKVSVQVETLRVDEREGEKTRTGQINMIDRVQKTARQVGIDIDFSLLTRDQVPHYREIRTDHGFRIILDKGIDMFCTDYHALDRKVMYDMSYPLQFFPTYETYIDIETTL